MNRRMMMAYIMSHQSRLPAEFQEVEYLESSGTQYIDSGVNPSLISPISRFKFYCVNIGSYSKAGVFGVWGPNDTRYGVYYNGIGIGTNASIPQIAIGNTYEIELNAVNRTAKINGDIITGFNTQNGFVNQNLLIMARYGDGIVESLLFQRLFYCKIYDNNTPIRDFVPCYRKADNVAGLYDLVNGVFYTNAGIGTFIVGGNV